MFNIQWSIDLKKKKTNYSFLLVKTKINTAQLCDKFHAQLHSYY